MTRAETATERRVALVIGNQAYPTMPLRNAAQDARDVRTTLTEVGFQTDLLLDATKQQMDIGIGRFVDRLQSGDVALVYYAGHGVQVAGENYLLPVDVATADEASVRYSSYSASLLHDRIAERGVRLKILILDACRNNPFRSSRSAQQGLAAMAAPGRGTFVAFATGPGSTADDNAAGRNGLFTSALLEALRAPGLDLGQVFDRVRERVDTLSRGRQTPWSNSSVVGRFLFRAAPIASPVTPSPAPSITLPVTLAEMQRKCESGDFNECARLGYAFENGQGVPVDRKRGADLYQRACEGGNAYGCFNLGISYEHGEGVVKDLARAAESYRRACDGGHLGGCTNLGNSFDKGEGVPKDVKRATELFQRSCAGGNAVGCFNLGNSYRNAKGVAKDLARAMESYRRACDGGEPAGCRNLGAMIGKGEGTAKDEKHALQLYRRGCDGGDALGCHFLGDAYLFGYGVPMNNKQAVEFHQRACDGGFKLSCFRVGNTYEVFLKDLPRAIAAFQKGCRKGDKDSCESLKRLQGK